MRIPASLLTIIPSYPPADLLFPALLAAATLALPAPKTCAASVFFGIDQGNGSPPTTPNNSLAARNAFVAALSNVGVQDFESVGTATPPATLSFTGSAITATATYDADELVNNTPDSGDFATSGTHFLDAAQGIRNDTFTFNTPIAGVGFYITDLSDGGTLPDQITLTATLAGGGTQTFTTNVTATNSNANVLFFGIVSNTTLFTQIQIQNTVTTIDDVQSLDDLTVGTAVAVPTPEAAVSAVPLLGLIAGYRLLTRRRVPAMCTIGSHVTSPLADS